MDTKEFAQKLISLPKDKLEQNLNKFIREHHRYQNLDKENRKIILDFVKKYRDRFRRGLGLSNDKFREDMHKLYKQRKNLGLSENDFEDIKKFLSVFKNK